jgi:hypothetical protein
MGHTGTGFRQGGQFLFKAGENYVETSNYGSTFALRLVPNGSTTLATRYSIDGDGDHTFTGNVEVQGSGEILKLESSAATGDNNMTFHDATAQKGLIGYESGSDNLIIENGEIGASIIFKNAHTGSGGTTFNGLELDGTGDVSMSGIVTATSGLNSNGAVVFTSSSEAMQLHRWTNAQQTTNLGSHGASQQGELWFNTTVNTFKGWNGSSVVDLSPKDETTVKKFNATPDQELYDDGNIEIHLDDQATDDIEVKVLTNPSSGDVQFCWWSPSDTSSGSASLNISDGQTPLNGNFGNDDTMQIRIFAPSDDAYPYWEVNITKGASGDPLVIRTTKWSSYD